ncbi:hypothetical protein NMD10_27835 (plasmid) [Citrobacter portucalensis]|uniref:hypothetical protein n=1 Tax=Citrobacter portucalensis TaxID=1639133 RepID=UPI00351D5843
MSEKLTLSELLAAMPENYEPSEEELAWERMRPVGQEFGGPDCPYTNPNARTYEDFFLEGYSVPDDYRLLKRTRTKQNLVYLDAPYGKHSTAYLIAWWFPKPSLVRLRVWRSLDEAHQEAIGDLPRAFVAQLLDQGYDVQLQPVNNAFWRGLAYWALDEGYLITAGRDAIRFEDQLVNEFYDRKRMMLVHGKPSDQAGRMIWPLRKTMRKLSHHE